MGDNNATKILPRVYIAACHAVEQGVVGEENASNITGHSGDAELVERGRQLEGSKHHVRVNPNFLSIMLLRRGPCYSLH